MLEDLMSDLNKVLDPFDIDRALDSIDLSFSNYLPSDQSLEFFNIIRMVTGSDFEFATPIVHYFLVDLLFNNITRDQFPYSEEVKKNITIDPTRIAIMMSRGLAKSSVVTAFMPVYLAIKGELPGAGKVYFMLSIAASTEGGARTINKSIRAICEDSIFCNNYFESMRFTDTEVEFIRKGAGSTGSRAFLHKAMGFGSGIRGQRANFAVAGSTPRPDIIAFDDTILNTQAAYSETIMNTLRETIQSDAINALKAGDAGRIWHVFTPFHLRDVNVQMITSNAYTPVVIPICEDIHIDLKEKDFKGAWPNMHTYSAVMSQYRSAVASNSTRSFNQERMLRISSAEDRMITDEMIESYSRKVLLKEIHAYNIYITTDFTTTSEAKSDFSAISAWAVNSNRDFYLVDLCVKRQGIGEQYEELFRMVNFWSSHGKSVEVGVEIDGQQKAHLFALKEMMLKKSEWFRFAKQKGAKYGSEGILSRATGGDKHGRFRNMLPQFQNHKIHFPTELETTPDMIEARKQLKYTTWEAFGGHDDFPDTISQLGMMEIVYPSVSPGSYSADSGKDRSIWRDLPSTDNDSAYSSYA